MFVDTLEGGLNLIQMEVVDDSFPKGDIQMLTQESDLNNFFILNIQNSSVNVSKNVLRNDKPKDKLTP